MSEKTKPQGRLRWGRRKTGKWNAAKTHALSRGAGDLAIAQQKQDGSWFWYGSNRNTSNRSLTLEEAKAEAMAHVKELGL